MNKIYIFHATTCIMLMMFLVATVAKADNTIGPLVSQAYRQCIGVAPSKVDETACLDQEYSRQKVTLSEAYNHLMRGQDPEQSNLIKKAQKAWLKFREVECEAQTLKGGSAAYNSHITCLIRLTAHRASEMVGYGAY